MIKCIKICFFLIFSSFLFAQETLKNADEYFKKNDFERALQYLQILLNNPEQLKGDELPFAYQLRAKTYINLLDQSVKNKDNKEIDRYKDAYFLAFQDLLDAQKAPMGDTAQKELDALSDYLHRALRVMGANFLNKIYLSENLQDETKKTLLDEAQKYLMAAITLEEEDYLCHDFYAQVMMLKRADEMAVSHFLKSKNYFLADKDLPDFEHFRVYGNLAILYMKKKESDKAIFIIEEGLDNIEKLFLETNPVQEDIKNAYLMMKSDLEGIEMDIYLNAVDKKEKALVKFKQLSEERPKDFAIRLAYAQILEQQNDVVEALNQYKKALEINKLHNPTWFNLGALQLNMALDLPKNNTENKKERNQLLEGAANAFKNALEIDNNDLQAIDALMKVYLNLEDLENYQYYRKLKSEKLKGG